MPLDQDQIKLLLANEGKRTRHFDNPRAISQSGPLRWKDKELRCVSLGCNSPTYCVVEGAPRCMMHALKQLNELVVEMTGEREKKLLGGITDSTTTTGEPAVAGAN